MLKKRHGMSFQTMEREELLKQGSERGIISV
jgi:hypothetical protein